MDVNSLMEYQNLLRKTLKNEEQTDRKIELLTIINQLTFGPRNLVQKEQVIVEALHHGFTEKEVERFILELIKENIIFESTPGYLKKK